MSDFQSFPPNFLAGCRLDRVPGQRRDPAWRKGLLQNPSTLIVPTFASKNLIKDSTETRAVYLPVATHGDLLQDNGDVVILGLDGERAYVAVALRDKQRVSELEVECGARFRELKTAGALLPRHEGGLLAYTRAITWWHDRNGFCANCGNATRFDEGGHVRHCRNRQCGIPHFPHTDAAIIVLITHEDCCLLARHSSWPANVYATIAGFLEPGESLEDAVIREAHEETGLSLTAVAYHSSQPWPFPASIMVGFTARAQRRDLSLDGEELEDARWFSREEMLESLANKTLRAPSRVSISYRLIEDWFNQGELGPLPDTS